MHFYDIDKMNSCPLRTERIVFCVSKHHRLAREKQITIEQLKGEPIIMYNTDSVQNELGGAFLYSSLLKNLPSLVGIPVVPAIEQEIGIVWKKGKYINGSVEKFIQFIKPEDRT